MRSITPRFEGTVAFAVPSNDEIAQLVLTVPMKVRRMGDLLFFPQPSAPENENVFFLGQWPQGVFIGLLPLFIRQMFPTLQVDAIFSTYDLPNRHMIFNSQFYVCINDIAFVDGFFLSQYFLELHKRIRFFYNDETPSQLCVEMCVQPGIFFPRDNTDRRLPSHALSFEPIINRRVFIPRYEALNDLWQQSLVPVVEEEPEEPLEIQAIKAKNYLAMMQENMKDMIKAIGNMLAVMPRGPRLSFDGMKQRIKNLFEVAREPWEDDPCYGTRLHFEMSQRFLTLRRCAENMTDLAALTQFREKVVSFSAHCDECVAMAEEYLEEHPSRKETPSMA